MITSYQEYKEYLQQDYRLTDIHNIPKWKRWKDRRFRFYKSLRRAEWITNCHSTGILNILGKFIRLRHHFLCEKYNWTIPINVFGPGLAIVHAGTIVVSGDAKIGQNCRIHVCTNIGRAEIGMSEETGNTGRGGGAPVLGDNIYIAPGVKMFGPINLGDNIAIGANSVVNSSFPEGNCTIAGVPARIISNNTSSKFILNNDS